MVINILKDGTVLQDITGHVIRYEDARGIYEIIDRINERESERKKIYFKEGFQNEIQRG